MPVTAVVGPHEVWGAWGGDPLAVPAVVVAAWVHLRGTLAIWSRVGRGRVVRTWQVTAWALGLLALLAALVSPLDALAGTLFSAHMAQHGLLTVVAAPLIAVSAPGLALLQGLPAPLRARLSRGHRGAAALRRAGRGPALPLLAVGSHTAAVWVWHIPALYEQALAHPALHALEHASLFGTALLLWWAVVVSGRRHQFGYGTGIAIVFAAALLHGGLGAVLTFSEFPLYPSYAPGAAAWGVDLVSDQRLAGVLMWAPAKFVHGIAGVALVLAWLGAVEQRSRTRERAGGLR